MKNLFFYVPIVFLIFIIYPVEVDSVSPNFSKIILHDKTDDVETYSENQTILEQINKIKSIVNIEDAVISSNGSHLEIRLFADDLPTEITSLNLSKSSLPDPFVNILVNSDDDESSGFFGYDYVYSITSERVQDTLEKIASNVNTTAEYLYDFGFLTKDEFQNKGNLEEFDLGTGLELLNWTINVYDIIDYAHKPLIFTSSADQKYISFIQDGIKIVLDLAQINFPEEYSLLIQSGMRTQKFKITDTFGQLHVPIPKLDLTKNIIQVFPGNRSELLVFNSTADNDLNVTIETINQTIPKHINMEFPNGNKFTTIDGSGSLPIKINIDPEVELRNHLLPIPVSFNMFEPIDGVDFNKTGLLAQKHNYSDTLYLNLDIQKSPVLGFKFPEIPPQYMAILLTAVVSVFIPSILRLIHEHKNKRIASNHLTRIIKHYDEDNIRESIDKLENTVQILKHDFIRGKITRDQYQILNEKLDDMLKKLIDKDKSYKSS